MEKLFMSSKYRALTQSGWVFWCRASLFHYCAVLMSHKNGETAVYGYNPALSGFFRSRIYVAKLIFT